MGPIVKGALGAVAVSTISTAAIAGKWNGNNPIAKYWLTSNNYVPKETNKLASFSKKTENEFALGCHQLLFGGKGFKQLYDDSNIDSQSNHVSSSRSKTLNESLSFGGSEETFLGCSTAYKRSSNVFEFELALRQGNKGLEERISVHTNKVISQLVFYERDQVSKQFKHLFGLYRYIKQEYQTKTTPKKYVYKWANPNPEQADGVWGDLNVMQSEDEGQLYFAVWVEGPHGKRIFDNLGVRIHSQLFSNIHKDPVAHEGASDFIYVKNKDQNGDLQKTTIDSNSSHYDLFVLTSLWDSIYSRKGSWRQIDSFCQSLVDYPNRLPLKELRQVAYYCYKPKSQENTNQN